jgi:hypothetical protein
LRSEPLERLAQVIEQVTRSSHALKPYSDTLPRHHFAAA